MGSHAGELRERRSPWRALDAAFDPCVNLHMGTTVYNEFAAGAVRYAEQFDTPHKQMMATLSAYKHGVLLERLYERVRVPVLRHGKAGAIPQYSDRGGQCADGGVLDFGSDLAATSDEFTVDAIVIDSPLPQRNDMEAMQ